jgi:hypothetical protein
MKSGLTMITALLLMFQYGGVHAANLKYVRTANHRDFIRVVFEFGNAAQFKEPVIEGEGKFSVAFYDSTTVLPRQIIYKTSQIQPVRSIEFTQKETVLTAVITLSYSDFNFKVFSLPDPNRVVIDVYKTTPLPGEMVPEGSLQAKPMVMESMKTETKDPKAVPEESSGKELTRAPAALIKPQSTPDEPETSRQIRPSESLPSAHENYTLQTYMLVLLNFLTIVIVLLLSVILFKNKSGINSKPVGKISDTLKTMDERIAAVDAMIHREFKKHD